MTVEETLLVVLTVAVVFLILMVVTVLVVAWQALKRLKRATTEIQHLTEKSSAAAGRVAPWGAVAITALQAIRLLNKMRR